MNRLIALRGVPKNLGMALALLLLQACKVPQVPGNSEHPSNEQQVAPEAASAEIAVEDSRTACIPMENGQEACTCSEYQDLLCDRVAIDESTASGHIAEADLCLLGESVPVSALQGKSLYEEFAVLDLNNVRSSLKPRGVAELAQLANQGFAVSAKQESMEWRSDAWVYALELFTVIEPAADDVYLGRLTSTALGGSYHAVKVVVVVREHTGPRVRELRQYFFENICPEIAHGDGSSIED